MLTYAVNNDNMYITYKVEVRYLSVPISRRRRFKIWRKETTPRFALLPQNVLAGCIVNSTATVIITNDGELLKNIIFLTQ